MAEYEENLTSVRLGELEELRQELAELEGKADQYVDMQKKLDEKRQDYEDKRELWKKDVYQITEKFPHVSLGLYYADEIEQVLSGRTYQNVQSQYDDYADVLHYQKQKVETAIRECQEQIQKLSFKIDTADFS